MNKGLTLTELLVASILMGIVMTGVAAFSFFIKQARDSTGAGTILAVQAATAMHYLVEDANKAVGDNSDRGVVSGTSGAALGSICFRHDTNDPASYADDTWACYWYRSLDRSLWKCAIRSAAAGAPPADFQACNPAIKLVPLVFSSPQYFLIVNESASGRFSHVDITLNTIADPMQASDTMNNPTYQLFTRVSPPAHGR